MKTAKMYLFLLVPLPSQDEVGGGGEVVATPQSPTFFMAKVFEIFCIDT